MELASKTSGTTPAPETELVESCPLCGAHERTLICAAFDRTRPERVPHFEYSRCTACGVAFQSVRPPAHKAALHYADDYEPHAADAPARAELRGLRRGASGTAGLVNRIVANTWRDPWKRRSKKLYTPPRAGATLLDYGCGSARFLDKARKLGWSTTGVDFVPRVVDAVRSAGHRAFLVADCWREIADNSLDWVRLNHVVEHLYDPRAELTRILQHLRPGGRLHMATPNGDALGLERFGNAWFPLECPRHVILYTPDTMKRLLVDCGFVEVEVFQEPVAKDSVRSRAYQLVDRGELAFDAIAEWVEDPLRERLDVLPARFAGSRGRADRLQVLARRPASS
ncbi:MAG: class I SAM-dependent methyltransferase [Planctomycetes bacterium]|nr:class I SAM-dependent methyltransferase [Planctomycetota bacterium]